MRDRQKLIATCETIEARLWASVVTKISKLSGITLSQKGVDLYLFPDYPISSFNRIMGHHKSAKTFSQLLQKFSDLNLSVPLYLSVPPLKEPYIEFLTNHEGQFTIADFESIYFTDLSSRDLSSYKTTVRIEPVSVDHIEEIVDLYTQEVMKSARLSPELVQAFFTRYYAAVLANPDVHMYQIRENDEMIALGGLYVEPKSSIGYIFSDMTHPRFRRQGLQRELIIHRGFEHKLDLVYATITADGYTSSIGNAEGLGAQHLYDRTIYRYSPQ